MVKHTWTLWDSFKVQGPSLAPILISAAVLIGLNAYTLIMADTISQENKTIIMYTELVLSIIASTYVFLLFMFVLAAPVYIITLLLVSPFGLTCIRTILQAYAQNKTYDDVLSVFIILSTLMNTAMVLGVAFGKLLYKPWF
jgi:hypothetical protein